MVTMFLLLEQQEESVHALQNNVPNKVLMLFLVDRNCEKLDELCSELGSLASQVCMDLQKVSEFDFLLNTAHHFMVILIVWLTMWESVYTKVIL